MLYQQPELGPMERGKIIRMVPSAASSLLGSLFEDGEIDGIVCISRSGGTILGASVIR